ncbi:MAG: hypothetical protein WAR79_00835 [Melioribacteraceae bacterium]
MPIIKKSKLEKGDINDTNLLIEDLIETGFNTYNDKGFWGFWFTIKSRLDMKEPESILNYILEVSQTQ